MQRIYCMNLFHNWKIITFIVRHLKTIKLITAFQEFSPKFHCFFCIASRVFICSASLSLRKSFNSSDFVTLLFFLGGHCFLKLFIRRIGISRICLFYSENHTCRLVRMLDRLSECSAFHVRGEKVWVFCFLTSWSLLCIFYIFS